MDGANTAACGLLANFWGDIFRVTSKGIPVFDHVLLNRRASGHMLNRRSHATSRVSQ